VFASPWKGTGRVRLNERGKIGEESGREGEDMDEREMGMHEKIAPKCNIFGILRTPFKGATTPCHTFKKISFHEQQLPRR